MEIKVPGGLLHPRITMSPCHPRLMAYPTASPHPLLTLIQPFSAYQVHTSLRAFALTAPSAWKALSPEILADNSLTSLESLHKCQLLNGADLKHAT